MATDPNKKTLRHFQCRDYLWETFEQMSSELECSVDYLINEAMRQYARSRGSAARAPTGAGTSPGTPSLPPGAADSSPPVRTGGPRPPTLPPTPAALAGARGGAVVPPKIPSLSGVPVAPAARGPGAMPPLPPAPGAKPPAMPPMPGGSATRSAGPGAPPPLPGGPPKLPPIPTPGAGAARPPAPGSGGAVGQTLYATFQGEQYPVTKEEFVIGRGQKTSDLVIRDSNVSRRHAVVVLHNGQYWIVDQQSTNGVEFMGAKIDRKRVEDGDSYKICDYEITFAYR